jgi:hypothetical protein
VGAAAQTADQTCSNVDPGRDADAKTRLYAAAARENSVDAGLGLDGLSGDLRRCSGRAESESDGNSPETKVRTDHPRNLSGSPTPQGKGVIDDRRRRYQPDGQNQAAGQLRHEEYADESNQLKDGDNLA